MQFDRLNIGKAVAETEFEKNLEKSYQRLNDVLSQILTKGLLFSDNFNCYIGTLTTSAIAGTESGIAHGLKRTPSGYIITSRDKAAIIYDGSTGWDSTNIYVRSNVASVAINIMVF
jgi:hypothetical protein